MIFLTYLKYIIFNNIYLFSITLLILLFTSLVEAGSILIIAPIIDILINSQTESEISKFLENVFIRIGLEFSLIYLFIIYFSITLFKSIFDVYSKRLLVLIKYEVIKKIVLETYTYIFDAGWHFFASEKHGKLINK